VKAKVRNFILQPPREFHRRYVTWEGYKEGWLGFRLSLLMAYYEWIMYRKLHALQKQSHGESGLAR
jgi:hypothetical protein